MALSDSSSTQDVFSEPTSSQENSRKPFLEKRPLGACTSAALPGLVLERGMCAEVGVLLQGGSCRELLTLRVLVDSATL